MIKVLAFKAKPIFILLKLGMLLQQYSTYWQKSWTTIFNHNFVSFWKLLKVFFTIIT